MDKSQIKSLLNQQKFRLTSERETVLDLFATSSSMLTPAQLHELAQQNEIQVGLTTVYRLLEVLMKIGVATPFLIDGTIFYTYCGCEHHHHFICLSCHKVTDVHGGCPAFKVPASFQVSSHRADFFGTCPDCQTENDMGGVYSEFLVQSTSR